MRAEKAQATRQRLVEVAKASFTERGYAGTSVEAVLKAAGVSRGALYHHFPSKEALFEAVYYAAEAHVAEAVAMQAAGAETPLEMLRAGGRAWLSLVRDPIVRQIILIDAPAVLGWERWREIDEEHFLGTIKGLIRQVVGDEPSAGRVDFLAHTHFGMLVELSMVLARGDQSDAAIEEAAGVMDDFITKMLG